MIILGSANTGRAAGGDGTDPYWENVILLIDANTGGFTDLSASAHTVTPDFDSVTISTAQAKFDTESFNFPGTAQARLSFSDSADFDLGTGDFTVELFAYRPTTAVKPILIFGDQTTNGDGFGLFWDTDRIYMIRANTLLSSDTTATMAANTWFHIAFSRVSNVLYFGVEGAIISSVAITNSFAPSVGTNNSRLAWGYDYTDTAFTGYMDQMRITKGVGRYTGSYTVPAAPFPTE